MLASRQKRNHPFFFRKTGRKNVDVYEPTANVVQPLLGSKNNNKVTFKYVAKNKSAPKVEFSKPKGKSTENKREYKRRVKESEITIPEMTSVDFKPK